MIHAIIKREDDLYTAHCLELDIVTTNIVKARVEYDIINIVNDKLSHAIENNNLEDLFKPAPWEVFKEFYNWRDHRKGDVILAVTIPIYDKKHRKTVKDYFDAKLTKTMNQLKQLKQCDANSTKH